MFANLKEYNEGLLFDIIVKPNSKNQSIKISKKKGIVISVINAAVKGKATKELIKFLENKFGKDVSVFKANKNYQKTIFVSNICIEEFKQLLNIK